MGALFVRAVDPEQDRREEHPLDTLVRGSFPARFALGAVNTRFRRKALIGYIAIGMAGGNANFAVNCIEYRRTARCGQCSQTGKQCNQGEQSTRHLAYQDKGFTEVRPPRLSDLLTSKGKLAQPYGTRTLSTSATLPRHASNRGC